MYHRGTEKGYKSKNKGEALNNIAYLYSLAKWTIERPFTLDNISQVLESLNNPQDKVKSIIVGGTNGKGSVSALISSILAASGYKVGLNTSPHLSRLNERIVINGVSVSNELLDNAAAEIRKVSKDNNILLSFHEAITVCAYLIFSWLELDWQVIEVGLGGRLDAANIIKEPKVSVLVSVDLDHEKILGNAISKIALEKAYIFRRNGIAVVGDLSKEAREVILQYTSKNAINSICYNKDYYIKESDSKFYLTYNSQVIEISSRLKGYHQIHNCTLAVIASMSVGITPENCQIGLKNVFWPGRLEEVNYKGKSILIDCAHNPAGMNSLVTYFKSRGLKNLSIAFGALQSKSWKEMIEILQPYIAEWNLFTAPSEVAVNSSDIAEFLKSKHIIARDYALNYDKFIDEISGCSSNMIVFAGSIYLVGALRERIIKKEIPLWNYSEKGN